MFPNFDEIIVELSYRVPEGIIDLTKPSHITELAIILREFGIYDAMELAETASLTFAQLVEDDTYQAVSDTGHISTFGSKETRDTAVKTRGYKAVGKEAEKDSKSTNITKSVTNHTTEKERINLITSIKDTTIAQTKQHYKNGFVKGAAPGNAGSMLNENGSNDVAQYCMQSGNTDIGNGCMYLYSQLKNGKLLEANSQGTIASGVSVKVLRKLRETNPQLKELNDTALSRILIAVSSGIIKANDSKKAIETNGWESKDCKMYGFFGDTTGLRAQSEFIQNSNKVTGPDGTEMPKEVALGFIKNSGKSQNPSDTAQFTYNSKTGETIIQFSSDKDSFDAIVAQSSFASESNTNKNHIDQLIKDGKVSQNEGDTLKSLIDTHTKKLNSIESELKTVASIPAAAMLKLDSKKVGDTLKTISAGADAMKYYKKIVPKYGKTDDDAITNFLKKAKDTPELLSKDESEIISRLKKSFGLDELVAKTIDDIRTRSVDIERNLLDEMNKIKIPIKNDKVGLGDYTDASNFIDKFHMAGAMGDKHGIFAYPGLFKVVCGFGVINDNIIADCMNTKDSDDFILKFGSEREELQRSKVNSITGSVRIAYFLNDKGQKIKIGEKRQRSKTGESGRFNTVYKWDTDTIRCFKSKNS